MYMAIYEVYVQCEHCTQFHSVHVKLHLDDETLDKAPLSKAFPQGALPPQIVFMQSNKYRCPHTKQLFSAKDTGKAILFAAESA